MLWMHFFNSINQEIRSNSITKFAVIYIHDTPHHKYLLAYDNQYQNLVQTFKRQSKLEVEVKNCEVNATLSIQQQWL